MMTRRKILHGLLSLLGLGATGAWALDSETLANNRNQLLHFLFTRSDNTEMKITEAPSIDDSVCVLTQEQHEGPFHSTSPMRSDVTEGKPGLPLELAMQVVSADGCTPVHGVTVEMWQCDANGNYSGHPDLSRDMYKAIEYLEWNPGHHKDPFNSDLWLRGAQQTDETGIVKFKTIFPGWYDGRTPHIHFKISGSDGEIFTSQFYFDDKLANDIYSSHPDYKAMGKSPYSPANDLVINLGRGAEGLLLHINGTDTRTATASAKVGINLKQA